MRLSLVSRLLMVPQLLGATFMVELLHDRRGLSLGFAAGLLAVTQGLGVAGRLGTGIWSDRVGGRLRSLRMVALVIAAGFGLATALEPRPVPLLLVVVLIVAAASAFSWNGLAFTAAGELAPPERVSGVLAFQNTATFISGAVAPPIGDAIADAVGWPAMLGAAAVVALLGWWLLGPIRGAA